MSAPKYNHHCMHGCGFSNIDMRVVRDHEKKCDNKPMKGGPKAFPGRPVRKIPIRDVRKDKNKKGKKNK